MALPNKTKKWEEMNKVFDFASPTRVDLSGGTLDLWPLYNFTGGAVTINFSISVLTRCRLELLPSAQVIVESKDIGVFEKFESVSALLKANNPKLKLYQALASQFVMPSGFHVTTSSESPVGGGLGGSSSLMISMLKSFSEASGQLFTDRHAMVLMAHNLESTLIGTPTGTQDYFPAINSGLHIIEYSASGFKHTRSSSTVMQSLVDHCVLVYTGAPHHSGLNNFEVLKRAVEKDEKTLRALRDLKQISDRMRVALSGSGDLSLIPQLFIQEYSARLELAPTFSSPEIEELRQTALQAGGSAVKICGAGGGGSVLLWVEKKHKENLQSAVLKKGFQILPLQKAQETAYRDI